MNPVIPDLDSLATELVKRGSDGRHIVAIAGPPGSGKSTLADKLEAELNARDPGSAAVLGMDGYHFDDAILNARGWRPRKGAPHTFDVSGLKHMLARLRHNDEPEVAVPVFDRGLETGRNSARIIEAGVRYILVEGNYLLSDETPWNDLSSLFDTTIFLDVPMDILRARLTERWRNLPPAEQQRKVEENDLPNARYCVERSRTSDFVVSNFGAEEST